MAVKQTKHLDLKAGDIDLKEVFADVVPLKVAPREPLSDPSNKKQLIPDKAIRVDRGLSSIRYICTDHLSEEDEATAFFREGQNQQVLRKLKRGYWPVCVELDLHGYHREDAQRLLSQLLHDVQRLGVCARIIHGQSLGSPNGPVMKRLTRAWLRLQPEVLAFCEAPAAQGGAGALLVLFKNRKVKKKE